MSEGRGTTRPGQASAGFIFVMSDSNPHPSFERIPNLQRPIVIESYCNECGSLVVASSDSYLLLKAEFDHTCSGWLKVF